MNYFLDTEFLEGTQKTFLGISKPTIDLISIGLVCENGNKYYAISKDFNLKEAWNRYDLIKETRFQTDYSTYTKKVYWIRENVLKLIWEELRLKKDSPVDKTNIPVFTYNDLKYLINKYGKTNKQIAKEVKEFCYKGCEWNYPNKENEIQFYGYYADYDWVVFCWLFGKMIDLPKGFPMFAFDIQQQIEEYKIDKNQLLKEVPQVNCHNALQDAIWNKSAYNWIQNKINNGK